jgi:hypothetical protein
MEDQRPMGMNFFSWIREGVRQAVLLGVNDAVEHIGTSPDGSDMGQRLLDVVRVQAPPSPPMLSTEPTKRRKLGRTLDEIHAGAAKGE